MCLAQFEKAQSQSVPPVSPPAVPIPLRSEDPPVFPPAVPEILPEDDPYDLISQVVYSF